MTKPFQLKNQNDLKEQRVGACKLIDNLNLIHENERNRIKNQMKEKFSLQYDSFQASIMSDKLNE